MTNTTRPIVVLVEGNNPPIEREMNDEEYAQWLIDAEKGAAELEVREAAKAKQDALRASAKAKLIAGKPLTEEEASVLVI